MHTSWTKIKQKRIWALNWHWNHHHHPQKVKLKLQYEPNCVGCLGEGKKNGKKKGERKKKKMFLWRIEQDLEFWNQIFKISIIQSKITRYIKNEEKPANFQGTIQSTLRWPRRWNPQRFIDPTKQLFFF